MKQSEGSNRRTAEDNCDNKTIKSVNRYEARQQIKKILRGIEEGSVVSVSYNLVLRGTKSRTIEGSITIGEKIAKLGGLQHAYGIDQGENLYMDSKSPAEFDPKVQF